MMNMLFLPLKTRRLLTNFFTEKMYNSAVKKYYDSRILGASSSHLEIIPRERNSKDIENCFLKCGKKTKLQGDIYQTNFDAPGKSTRE